MDEKVRSFLVTVIRNQKTRRDGSGGVVRVEGLEDLCCLENIRQ
jgi:hypothetical protein